MASRLDPLEPYLPPVLLRFIRRIRRRLLRVAGMEVAPPAFEVQDIDDLRALFAQTGGAPGTSWDRLRDAHMPLPTWFRRELDPWSTEYREQQEKLWQMLAGVDRRYNPDLDEMEAYSSDVDAVRRPAYFVRRDAQAIVSASDHVLATGMLLKHSGLKAGEFALEFGAGFGQSALTLARLGVNVDTVDVSRNFCRWVQQQADFFEVPLRSHHGQFGTNPRPGMHYQLIWFYESFHHCWNFDTVVPQLADMLADGGRVILGGEPVFEGQNPAVPYPWGVRLHSEVAAVMRQTRWMELGFSEPFLFELFERSGFKGHKIDCPSSLYGRLYVFERAPRPSPGPVERRWAADDPAVRTQIGARVDGAIYAEAREGFVCYGPYVPVDRGEWWALIELASEPAPSGQIYIDVATKCGDRLHAARWLDLLGKSCLRISFGLPEPCEDLEIRVYANPTSRLAVRSVVLARAAT